MSDHRSTRQQRASLTTQRALLNKLYASKPITTQLTIRVEATLSRVGQPLQFGLYAVATIPAKTKVVYYGGLMRFKSDIVDEASHVRSMHDGYVLDGNVYAALLHRPVPVDEAELERWCAVPAFDAPVHPEFGPSPTGYMANSAGMKTNNNVCIKYRSFGGGLLDVPYLVATRDIAPGEQILCGYGNESSKAHTDDFVSL